MEAASSSPIYTVRFIVDVYSFSLSLIERADVFDHSCIVYSLHVYLWYPLSMLLPFGCNSGSPSFVDHGRSKTNKYIKRLHIKS